MGYNPHGRQNNLDELVRQWRWLKHKVDNAGDLEKKNKAMRKLNLWEAKHASYMSDIRRAVRRADRARR